MKNSILISLVLACCLSLFSCQQTNDLAEIKDSFTLSRNGADMPVYTFGNVESKVFIITLHGGPGGNGLLLRADWSTEMEEQYAMVYWDQRGSGMSQGKLSKENLNLEEMKKDVLALVTLLKSKFGDDIELFLLGHSWGSILGGHVLADNQELFNGYIGVGSVYNLCNLSQDLIPTYNDVANEQVAANNDVKYWNEMLDLVADTDITDCYDYRLHSKASKSQELLKEQGVISPEKADLFNHYIVNNRLTVSSAFTATNELLTVDILEEYDLTNILPDIKLPALILHGKYDVNVGLQMGETYFDLLGSTNKTFGQFDKSAHSPFLSEPEPFRLLVEDFIEANR